MFRLTLRRFGLRRLVQACGVSVLAVVMLGASGAEGRFNRVGHQMVCVCSCGQILVECNHVGCPDSDRMLGELRTQMTTGGTDTQILNWFAQKYGAMVLAAPIRGGFDTVAWIVPGVLFLLATVGTALLVRRWTSRAGVPGMGQAAMAAPGYGGETLRARIRRETEL